MRGSILPVCLAIGLAVVASCARSNPELILLSEPEPPRPSVQYALSQNEVVAFAALGYISADGIETEPRFDTEAYDSIDENPFRSVAQAPLSTFAIDVDTAVRKRPTVRDGASLTPAGRGADRRTGQLLPL